jgi:hypothetical protein
MKLAKDIFTNRSSLAYIQIVTTVVICIGLNYLTDYKQPDTIILVVIVSALLLLNREFLNSVTEENMKQLRENINSKNKNTFDEINKLREDGNENNNNILSVVKNGTYQGRTDIEKNLLCNFILLYDRIDQIYLEDEKKKIIRKARKDLDDLYRNKRTIKMPPSEGLRMSIDRLKKLGDGDIVKAVTFEYKEEKQNKQLHKIWAEYRQANITAATNGATVERIFIKDYDTLENEKFWGKKYVTDHITNGTKIHPIPTKGKLYGYFYDKKLFDIAFNLNDYGDLIYGFMMINEEVIMLDQFDGLDNGIAKGNYGLVANCNPDTVVNESGVTKLGITDAIAFFEDIKQNGSELLNKHSVKRAFGESPKNKYWYRFWNNPRKGFNE